MQKRNREREVGKNEGKKTEGKIKKKCKREIESKGIIIKERERKEKLGDIKGK